MFKYTLVAVLIWLVAGCSPAFHEGLPATIIKKEEGKTEPPTGDTFERKRWLHRVARLLRGGKGLTDRALENQLIEKTDDQIIDYFLNQPEFGDAVLDFNLHFLGFPRDRLRDRDGELNQGVFEFPSAIHSAQQALKNGDYLRLLDLEQPLFFARLNSPAPIDGEILPDEARRAALFQKVQSGLQRQIDAFNAFPNTSLAVACEAFLNEVREGGQIADLGLQYLFVDVAFNSNIWYGRLYEICTGPLTSSQKVDFKQELQKIYDANTALQPALKSFEPVRYSTRNLSSIKALDVKKIGIAPRWLFFGDNHRQILMNSSTSYNRKRAAYMLKTFFCDDLTPINVESPNEHAGQRHGSEASCMACHYKLDPMAGYFRDYGYLFSDYSTNKFIRFDDNASALRSEYNRAWAAPAGSGREWDVGYIRSTTRPELNAYGSTLEDLFATIRREPEVKRCLVKRMFGYFVSERQAVDGGYMDYLQNQFITKTATNSTQAFKEAAKRLLTSRSFRTENPDPSVYYDFPPGYNPIGKPPGRVAHLLQKNCAGCHHSTIDNGGLDVRTWIRVSNGESTFSHIRGGKQLSKRESMSRILDRLTTADTNRRMPLRQYMDALEREDLFRWVNEYLDSSEGK